MTTQMSAPAVSIRGLVKSFGGVRAVDGLDLDVPRGSVLGFVGPNGAGKTTTVRMLLGLAEPTAGDLSVLGVRPRAALRRIGYLPDVPGYYPWMPAEEFLRFIASLFGLTGADADARVSALLDMSGLAGVRTRIGGFSRGMRQRLGIAQALVNAPELLVLDEPTSALDPMGRKDVLDMIDQLRGRTTVLFSSHILSDVERVCDRVAILDHGRLRAQGTLKDVIESHAGVPSVLVEVEPGGDPDADQRPVDAFATELSAQQWASSITAAPGAHSVSFTVRTSDLRAAGLGLPRLVTSHGLSLLRYEPREPSLEDVFVSLVADPVSDGPVSDGSVSVDRGSAA